MSSSDLLRYRGILTVAVGAGVVIGAAGMFIYHLFGERQRMLLQQDISQLGLSIEQIRKDIDAIRALRTRRRRSHRNTASVLTDSEAELFSTVGADELDEEFYDFSSDENTLDLEDHMIDFSEIDELLNGDSQQKTKAYGLLLEAYEKCEHTAEVDLVWRLAKACHMMATIYGEQEDDVKQQELIISGLTYAEHAVNLDRLNANAHKWFAICIGARSKFGGVRQRLRDGIVFRDHVNQAIKINPQDPTLHHLLGRFNFEIASLSWIERRLAGTWFEIPEASYASVVACLLEAEKLNPTPWKENRLLLAKTYFKQKDYQQGLEWLDRAAEVPVVTPEDKVSQKEIESLLNEHKLYRQPK